NGVLVPSAREPDTLFDPWGTVKGPGPSPKLNAFAYCIQTKELLHIENALESPFLPPGALVRSFTIAPVTAGTVSGILYLGATRPVPWPYTVAQAAISLADQLALYMVFQRQLVDSRAIQEELRASVTERARLLLDFQHQLRTPIYIARNSLEA